MEANLNDREEILARIEELRLSFNHCGLCDTPRRCSWLDLCLLGDVSEEEEYLRLKLLQLP